ncbi:Cytochrome C553 (soluble cytochrome f) [hydrothermal vent metagenome]|uniref:Cytochrome C553 (Soluble cytochrome f) n=1 Tax=hydrothermal vent metagenome TaxID=652676 RepID=A0A1W1C1U3_9ZZZZ
MNKLTVLSIITASLLLTGCGDSATGATAKASQETPAKHESTTEKAKSAATEAKEAATVAVNKATQAVKEKAAEVKEQAAAKVEEVKAKAAEAVDSAKAAVAKVADKATEAVAAATAPDGKALFAKCAGCHGADGKTAALGKSEIIAGQSAADLEKKITEYKAGTRNTKGMGALMKGQVAGLSDADIKAVATYISGL